MSILSLTLPGSPSVALTTTTGAQSFASAFFTTALSLRAKGNAAPPWPRRSTCSVIEISSSAESRGSGPKISRWASRSSRGIRSSPAVSLAAPILMIVGASRPLIGLIPTRHLRSARVCRDTSGHWTSPGVTGGRRPGRRAGARPGRRVGRWRRLTGRGIGPLPGRGSGPVSGRGIGPVPDARGIGPVSRARHRTGSGRSAAAAASARYRAGASARVGRAPSSARGIGPRARRGMGPVPARGIGPVPRHRPSHYAAPALTGPRHRAGIRPGHRRPVPERGIGPVSGRGIGPVPGRGMGPESARGMGPVPARGIGPVP